MFTIWFHHEYSVTVRGITTARMVWDCLATKFEMQSARP
jgi:hypothetical protein